MKHLSVAPIKGSLLALPTNSRLGWKGLPGTNSLAYNGKSVNYGRNKFHDTGPLTSKGLISSPLQCSQIIFVSEQPPPF